MFEAVQSGNPRQRLLAATLFGLASQQEDGAGEDDNENDNNHGPSDALARVVEHDAAALKVASEEEFLASPVVQTARAAHGLE